VHSVQKEVASRLYACFVLFLIGHNLHIAYCEYVKYGIKFGNIKNRLHGFCEHLRRGPTVLILTLLIRFYKSTVSLSPEFHKYNFLIQVDSSN